MVEIILPFNKQFLEFPEKYGLDLTFYIKPFSSDVDMYKKYLKFGRKKWIKD